ncbi:MAG: hypothetical protein MKZ70_07590, partial [Opitutales bacterium]|nr:hypothetical protein [Opitutales bacterium]
MAERILGEIQYSLPVGMPQSRTAMDFERDSSGGRRVAMEVQQYTPSPLATRHESAGVLPATPRENRIDPT